MKIVIKLWLKPLIIKKTRLIVEDIKNAGHFIQEDAGPELAVLINDFIAGKL